MVKRLCDQASTEIDLALRAANDAMAVDVPLESLSPTHRRAVERLVAIGREQQRLRAVLKKARLEVAVDEGDVEVRTPYQDRMSIREQRSALTAQARAELAKIRNAADVTVFGVDDHEAGHRLVNLQKNVEAVVRRHASAVRKVRPERKGRR
ncbi:MAG: hypothetical protein AB7P99_04815 [Vicinamibacterales bacterium]